MRDKAANVPTFPLPSTSRLPGVACSQNLADYLEATEKEFAKIPKNIALHNTIKAERFILGQLTKDRLCDKGRGIAILIRADKTAKVPKFSLLSTGSSEVTHIIERQLNNHHYEKLECDIIHVRQPWSVQIFQKCTSTKKLTKKAHNYLKLSNTRSEPL